MEHPHGDRNRYLQGCRCARCRRANSNYKKRRTAELAVLHGRPIRQHVPAGPARRVVTDLRASGLKLADIAARSGVSVGTVARLSSGTAVNVEHWVVGAISRLA